MLVRCCTDVNAEGWDPGRNQDKKEEAEAKFKDVAEAYDVLTDTDK